MLSVKNTIAFLTPSNAPLAPSLPVIILTQPAFNSAIRFDNVLDFISACSVAVFVPVTAFVYCSNKSVLFINILPVETFSAPKVLFKNASCSFAVANKSNFALASASASFILNCPLVYPKPAF